MEECRYKQKNPCISKSAIPVSREHDKCTIENGDQDCMECHSIGLHLVLWPTGRLEGEDVWQWLGMDTTPYDGKLHSIHNLAIPRWKDTESVVNQIKTVFCGWAATAELLTSNEIAFSSKSFKRFLEEWSVRIHFRCAWGRTVRHNRWNFLVCSVMMKRS